MIPNLDTVIYRYHDIRGMEILQMIGWFSLGHVQSYIDLEVGTRKLAREVTGKLFLDVRGKK